MSVEAERIAFLVKRDGMAQARAWALDAARTYRKAVLTGYTDKPKFTMYRRPLIASYLAFKRFALRGEL